MIIKTPTGLYSSMLPNSTSTGLGVIYTISYGEIKRDQQAAHLLPIAIRNNQHLPLSFNRKLVGDLVFTTRTMGQSSIIDGTNNYAIGQVLDFSDIIDTLPMQPAETVVIRHNTNYINSSAMGIDDAEKLVIDQYAVQASNIINVNIIALLKEQAELINTLATTQKRITNTDKVLSGLGIISNTTGNTMVDTIDKLNQLKIGYIQQVETVQDRLNLLPAMVKALRDQLLMISELVK